MAKPRTQVPPPGDRLRLRAHDADDLQVLSACLQDAILPIGDMTYERAARRFVLVANRFCWERADDREPAFDRVNCGVVFDGVSAVRLRRIDRNDRSLIGPQRTRVRAESAAAATLGRCRRRHGRWDPPRRPRCLWHQR